MALCDFLEKCKNNLINIDTKLLLLLLIITTTIIITIIKYNK